MRKVKFAENKLIAVDLMLAFSKYLEDLVVLDRVLPYYVWLLEDAASVQPAAVRAHTIHALSDCLASVQQLDAANISVFTEIIFGVLERASRRDEAFLVRAAVAKTIVSNFLLMKIFWTFSDK